ncbi:putative ribonuclease H-like domain-containing protein, partial [Tanacetum coccineum]
MPWLLKMELEGMIGATKLKKSILQNYGISMAHTSSGSSSSSDSEFKTGLGYNAASLAVENFVNSSEMLKNQKYNKSKSNKGCHAVPPPYTGNFIPSKPDLTFMDEIVESENMDVITVVTPSNVKKVKSNHESADVKNNGDVVEPKTVRKSSFRPPVIEDWNSNDDSKVEFIPNAKDKTIRSSTEKIKFIKSGKINTAGASVNTAVRPVNTVGSKTTVNHSRPISNAYKKGYSQVTRPFNKYSAIKNSIFIKKVNTVRVKDTTARDRAVVSENKGKWANVVKASACWSNPQQKEYKEKGVIDSGCSRHMTGNKCYLTEYEDYDDGFVSFGDGKGRISKKGKIKTGTLNFDNVYFCKELKYNLFSVSQIYDKKNNVLFTLSYFKLLDESQVLLRVPRKDNIYSVDLKSVVPTKGLTCLFDKATIDESNLWHMRLGHINFKNMNKLVRGNLVREIENQLDHKVKVIRSDNGTEFKNSVMNLFCEMKGIKREFSIARTPQQNGVAERRNRTLIDATRTMSVDSKLPTTIWAEAVNTACYVLNRVLVIKPNSKTPYKLIHGRTPLIDFMKPFGCHVTILNTRDHLGNGPDWLFDVDSLSKYMNYVPVFAENQTNGIAGTRDNIVAGQAEKKKEPEQEYILIPICSTSVHYLSRSKDSKEDVDVPNVSPMDDNTRIFAGAYDDEDVGGQADLNNLETTMNTLVDLPNGKRAIGTKWVFRNKKDERGIVVRNKARLVAQDGCKECLLYGTIEEEVYVCQPPGFEDPQFPDKVYKVEKALYGLHQAPRAWYETLSTCLLENGFRRGLIDNTFFIKKSKGDILLVQVYVYDIIFGSTKKSLCIEFEGLMHKKFQMSSKGELTFFLVKTASTPIETNKALLKDKEVEDVDVHLYRSMIGSLMYLTASRPDIMDLPFDLKAFSDSDYAGASLNRKSTTGGYQFLGKRLISWQYKKQTIVAKSTTKEEYAATNCCGQVSLRRKTSHSQLVDKKFNSFSAKGFSEDVCRLILRIDKHRAIALLLSHTWKLLWNQGHSREMITSQLQGKLWLYDEVPRIDADLHGTPTDQTKYHSMIGGLIYLTASQPDIAFATFFCARYQARPTEKHLKEVKRIFPYLRQFINRGLWYSKDSGFESISYSDADHAGCHDDCKST